MSDAVRVAMWSGPRNISTAIMRAFENRPDTVVVDEPLYAAYLARTGIDHPARDEVIASQPTDLAAVTAQLSEPLPAGRHVHYAKHMAHHVPREMDLSWTLRFRNVLLIRDPIEVVASYVRARTSCEPEDIGLPQQGWLSELWDEHGAEVPVLDAREFLLAPEAHLRWLCDWLAIPFCERMLA
ncbi:MAG TPA: HAD family hydrolase, partial [Acidimicrobiia bacterium]